MSVAVALHMSLNHYNVLEPRITEDAIMERLPRYRLQGLEVLGYASHRIMNNHTGKTIAGRYEVITLLGRGGMAEVYLANDTRIGAEVALKLTGFAQ